MTVHLGAVTGLSNILEVTLSLDTNAYADGDLLANVQEIPNFFREPNQTAIIHSVNVLDIDDQGGILDLYFTDNSTTWGTENAAASITDAIADDIFGQISVVAADYTDLGAQQIAFKNNENIMVKSASGSTSLYVAAISRDTKTYTASGLQLKIGVILD